MPTLKPTHSKLYLTFYLSFNIFFAYVLQGVFGIDILSIIAGYPIAPHYFLFFLVTILSLYIFACIVTIKLPQIWQPTLLKTILALLTEPIFFAAFILSNFYNNITFLILDIIDPMPDISGFQGGFNPCPASLYLNNPHACGIHRYSTSTIEVVLVTGSLVIAFAAYTLSCTIVFLYGTPRKPKKKK